MTILGDDNLETWWEPEMRQASDNDELMTGIDKLPTSV